MLLEILRFPDPRLRRKCSEVSVVGDEHREFAQNMLETMYHSKGIGLAAAQVNSLIRLIVIDTRPRDGGRYKPEDQTELERAIAQPLVLFNPRLINSEGKNTFDEGCLSVPGYFETVQRKNRIELEYLDINGEERRLVTDGLLSICIQHEIDHLDGKLFIDRLSPIKSVRIKNKIKKFGYDSPADASQDEPEEEKSKEVL
jgi:peptide deformylase